MWNELLTPVVILALIGVGGLKLRLWYADRLARMTPAERKAEDRCHDSDQVW